MPFSIHSTQSINLNISAQLTGCTVPLVLSMDNEELDDYDVTEEHAKDVHIAIVARLNRESGGWNFNATPTGFTGNAGACVRSFGLNI